MARGTPGTIHWSGLAVSAREKVLVHEHSGTAGAGRLLGVLGPSGAGKSTLLLALAGVAPPRTRVAGQVWGDGGSGCAHRVGLVDGTVALLEQDDSFFSELTLRETLCFASELAGLSPKAAAVEAQRLLLRVGLAPLAERRVGERRLGSGGSGVSGGERRRLAVACAIAGEGDEDEKSSCEPSAASATASQPPRKQARALLADEPTTGLDAFQAARLVTLLRDLARSRQCAAVATLHQPRASIWSSLDDVMLLAPDGRVVYCGPRADALSYFEQLGHACPREGMNPAEFLIDFISVNTEEAAAAEADRARIVALAAAFRAHQAQQAQSGTLPLAPLLLPAGGATAQGQRPTRQSAHRAFWLLLKRSLLQMFRDRVTNALRFLATGGLALVFAAQFGHLDAGGRPSARSSASRVALLSFGVIAMAFVGEMRALDRFSKERAVVARERAAGLYSGLTYLVAKAVAELPSDACFAALFGAVIHPLCGLRGERSKVVGVYALLSVASAALGLAVGAAAPRADQAMAIGAPIMVMHMLTGVIDPAGKSAQEPNVLMKMLRAFSPIRYGVEALCHAEYAGAELALRAIDVPKMGGLALVRTGDEVLERLGVTSTYDEAMCRLVLLLCLHLAAGVVTLALARPRYARHQRLAAVVPVHPSV